MQALDKLVSNAADKSRTARDLDPYGLAFRGGCWYVVGHCHLRNGPRTFRVDRMTSVARTSGTFERPANLDTLAREPTAPKSSSVPTSPPRRGRSSLP